MYVSTDHTVESSFLAVLGKVVFKMKYKVYCFFDPVFKEQAKAKVPKTKTMTNPINPSIESKNEIICFVSQHCQPWRQSGDDVKHVTMYHKIVSTICTYVFYLIYQFNYAKPDAVLHERS